MKNDSSFYLSYATLLAGLLFIVLFIFTALLLKNTFLQSEFELKEKELELEKQRLYTEEQNFKESQLYIYALARNLENNSSVSNINQDSRAQLVLLARLQREQEKIRGFRSDFERLKDELAGADLKKSDLILQMQAKLDANISLDSKRGSLRLMSADFFEKDSYVLKNDSKERLRRIFNDYFDAILEDENLFSSLEAITLFVHTNSQGSYAYKLDLSNKRANELSNFIYSFYKDERLQNLLLASGKSFSSPIVRDGIEDSVSSERIELNFIFSNESLLKNLQNFFNER